jgi:DNA-binding YbaB/EbfC family protein
MPNAGDEFAKGFPGGDLGGLLKQAQEMQKGLEAAQKELMELEATGEAGVEPLNVKVTINGRHEVKRVYIAQAVLREEKEFIEDMIASAFNAALRKAEEMTQAKMAGLMGNMKMPEGFPFPFGGGDEQQGG